MVSEQMTNVKPDFPSFSQQPNSPEKMQNSSSSSARVMLSTNLQAISPKLIKGNYRFWRSQVLFAVGAHELENHLTGLDPCPSPFINEKIEDSDANFSGSTLFKKVPNPNYTIWKRVDKALVSWLLASISESMFGHISKCTSASEIWCTLECEFQSESKAKMMHLRSLLQSTTKENCCVSEYVLKMKEIANQLSASGQVVTDEELLSYILDGLGSEFDAAVFSLLSRIDSISIQEAQFLLQKYELRIEKHNTVNSLLPMDSHVSSVHNVTTVNPNNSSAFGSSPGISSSLPSFVPSQNFLQFTTIHTTPSLFTTKLPSLSTSCWLFSFTTKCTSFWFSTWWQRKR